MPSFATPSLRGATRSINMSPPWTADMAVVFYSGVLGASLSVAFLVIYRGQRHCRWIVVACFAGAAILNLIEAAASLDEPSNESNWGFSVVHSAAGMVLAHREASLRHLILGIGISYLIIELVVPLSSVSIEQSAAALRASPPTLSLAMIILYCAARLLRRWHLRRAQTAAEKDACVFNDAWARELAIETARVQQNALHAEVLVLSSSLCPAHSFLIQQMNVSECSHIAEDRKDKTSSFLSRAYCNLCGLSKEDNSNGNGALRCLDTLYSDAGCAYIILISKLASWTTQSSGPFHFDPSEGHALENEQLKSPERAMDKAMLQYGGDISRLVDICRQV